MRHVAGQATIEAAAGAVEWKLILQVLGPPSGEVAKIKIGK